jgi:hypothetical protein
MRRLQTWISEREIERFRAISLPGKPRELFTFHGFTWDVDRALYILHHFPRTPVQVEVVPLALQNGFDRVAEQRDEGGDARFLRPEGGGTWINLTVIEGGTLLQYRDIPLIFVQSPLFSDKLMIDGLHRLYLAYRQQREHLLAYTLNLAEERLCRRSTASGDTIA